MPVFKCDGFTAECECDVPLDDLGLLYEMYAEGDSVSVSLVVDDRKYHAKRHPTHLRYVRYCTICLERLSPVTVEADLEELAYYEAQKLGG